ncbi:MAG: hypothetical protein H0W85_10895 [Methylotenera sp.]|nr:hypothetical protein [Methylotenera sp.]
MLIKEPSYTTHSHQHAVCWRAIFAGAIVAAALSILLSLLGTGFGLSMVSPWSNNGVTAATFGITAILWLSITQIIASGMGGFLAGRLRNRAINVHQDEVYFRDTAHGFLTWAIALLVTATLFASALGSVISSSVKTGASVAGGVAAATAAGLANDDSNAYFIDSLFRKAPTTSNATATSNASTTSNSANAAAINASNFGNSNNGSSSFASSQEVRRIFTKGLHDKSIAPNDASYVAQLVAQRTGLSQDDAEKRVNDTFKAIQDAELAVKDAADKARKAAAYIALWAFIALLIGAFTASLAATWGGRCRDTDL